MALRTEFCFLSSVSMCIVIIFSVESVHTFFSTTFCITWSRFATLSQGGS